MTTFILITTCLISFLAFQNPEIRGRMIFNPYVIHERKEWYRFITSGLIHADWIHLLINMFVLYSFGDVVEGYYKLAFGERWVVYFPLLYFGGMMTSVLPTYRKHHQNPGYNALGASGAVSAVVFAFIVFNPLQRLCLYGLLCLPGIIFGVLYLAYCYYMDKKGGSNINHDAHLWGALYGFGFTILVKPELIGYFFDQLIYFRHAI
jgi:membrane associated rhomboid family serine protease